MKTVFNIVLFLCAAGLAYVCYDSIRGPAGFRQKKEAREKARAEESPVNSRVFIPEEPVE